MAAEGPIAHRYNGEADLASRAGQAGAHFDLIEENVAVGPSASMIHDEWMNSPGHRENLLNPEVDRVGVAVVASRGVLYAVADYSHGVESLNGAQVEARVAGLLIMAQRVSIVPILAGAGRVRHGLAACRGRQTVRSRVYHALAGFGDKKLNPNRAVNWVIQVERIRQFSKLASATRRWRVGKFAVTIAHEVSFLAGRQCRWETLACSGLSPRTMMRGGLRRWIAAQILGVGGADGLREAVGGAEDFDGSVLAVVAGGDAEMRLLVGRQGIANCATVLTIWSQPNLFAEVAVALEGEVAEGPLEASGMTMAMT
jgi:hypothetical protein